MYFPTKITSHLLMYLVLFKLIDDLEIIDALFLENRIGQGGEGVF